MHTFARTLIALAATAALAPWALAQTPTLAKPDIGKTQVDSAMSKDGKESGKEGGGKKNTPTMKGAAPGSTAVIGEEGSKKSGQTVKAYEGYNKGTAAQDGGGKKSQAMVKEGVQGPGGKPGQLMSKDGGKDGGKEGGKEGGGKKDLMTLKEGGQAPGGKPGQLMSKDGGKEGGKEGGGKKDMMMLKEGGQTPGGKPAQLMGKDGDKKGQLGAVKEMDALKAGATVKP